MNHFTVGCRVRCRDATPLPINVPGALATDFSFPGGFLEEGAVYCVKVVGVSSQGRPSLRLVGLPVLYRGYEISWDCLRFQRAGGEGERARAVRKSAKPQAALAP